MTAPKYPSYKDVPIPWVDSIPEHWDWKPVLGVASERDEDNKGMKEDNLLSLSYGNIVNKDINTSDGLLPESFETYQIVRPGDIVLRLTDLQNDKRSLRSALVTQTGIITSAYLALKPERIDPKYLGYLLRAYDVSKVFYSMGGGLRQSMKYGDIKRMPLVIPTKAEQLVIAAFLDRETAKIDTLIAEQQRLIELLQEKRQAVISHAVTKGLNPDAPMKDSGVEWLGEVPEHWQVKPIRHTHAKRSGGTPSKSEERYWLDGTIPWASSKDLKKEAIQDTIDHITEAAVSESGVELQPVDTVFICVRGMILAHTFPVTTPRVPMAINQDLKALIPCPGISANYLAILLRGAAKEILARVDEAAHGTKVLRMSDFNSMPVAVPPPEEQEQISRFADKEFDNIASLVERSSKSIDLLQERRSALISAAVTGQIDVRGLVTEEEP